MSQRRAFITGISGQDGSYLAEFLLEKGYKVYGLLRYSTTGRHTDNIDHLLRNIEIVEGDLTDQPFLQQQLAVIKPHEVYNLASQSHVGMSFKIPQQTVQVTGTAVIGLLEAVRMSGFNSRVYQASTSEMFGNVGGLIDESAPFRPVSPYGCAKVLAHNMCGVYREGYNMFVSCGILFNHESPRRGEDFVTRKIATQVAEIVGRGRETIALGNLDAARDWGHAKDYVEAMWLMLQHNEPDDFVIATGETRTVREFVDIAFKCAGISSEGRITVDPRFYRPIDVQALVGDATKARTKLGWKPRITFEEMVQEMVEMELRWATL